MLQVEKIVLFPIQFQEFGSFPKLSVSNAVLTFMTVKKVPEINKIELGTCTTSHWIILPMFVAEVNCILGTLDRLVR